MPVGPGNTQRPTGIGGGTADLISFGMLAEYARRCAIDRCAIEHDLMPKRSDAKLPSHVMSSANAQAFGSHASPPCGPCEALRRLYFRLGMR